MIWLAVAGLAVWLLVLTVLAAALIKNMATIGLAMKAGTVPIATVDFDADGPVLGSALPDALRESLPVISTDRRILLFLSPGCGTCLETAEELARRSDLCTAATVFVLGTSDSKGRAAREISEAASRGSVVPQIVIGDGARMALQALSISSLPTAIVVDSNVVKDKIFVRRVDAFRVFLDELPTEAQTLPKGS